MVEFLAKLKRASDLVSARLLDGKVEIAGLSPQGTDLEELSCVAQLMLMSSIRDHVCNPEFAHIVEQPILAEVELVKDQVLNEDNAQFIKQEILTQFEKSDKKPDTMTALIAAYKTDLMQ